MLQPFDNARILEIRPRCGSLIYGDFEDDAESSAGRRK